MSAESNKSKKQIWSDIYLGLWDGTIAEGWFRWAEWLLVTAALYALGRAGGSRVVEALAYFSAVLTGFYGLHKIEEALNSLKPVVRRLPSLLRIIVALVVVSVFMGAAVALANAIEAAFVLEVKTLREPAS